MLSICARIQRGRFCVGTGVCKTRTTVPHSIRHFCSKNGYTIFHRYEYHLDSLCVYRAPCAANAAHCVLLKFENWCNSSLISNLARKLYKFRASVQHTPWNRYWRACGIVCKHVIYTCSSILTSPRLFSSKPRR